MHRRLFRLLLSTLAVAFILIGVHAHLRAQEAKPTPNTNTAPRLYLWKYPGMNLETDYSKFSSEAITGYSVGRYADVFDYYARKMGAHDYDLKLFTTFQTIERTQGYYLSTDPNTIATCNVDAQTLQATFSRHTEHEYVTIFLTRSRQSNITRISMTATSL